MEIKISQVKAVLESQMESDEPDAILEILKKQEGKQITKRTLALLPGGAERWFIRDNIGMLHLEDREYRCHNGGKGISLLIAHHTKNVMIDTAKIVERNTAYFKGRIERNAKRRAALADGSLLGRFADAMTLVLDAVQQLEEETKNLQMFIGYGARMSPDQYEWERLAGIREPSK